MIFEHTFYDNFPPHTHIIFSLSLYCFDFRTNTYFFFVNYDCPINCQPNSCSNNIPLFLNIFESIPDCGVLHIYILSSYDNTLLEMILSYIIIKR